MRIFFIHIPKTAGVSIEKLIRTYSHYKVYRIKGVTTVDELNQIAKSFNEIDYIFVMGHLMDPHVPGNIKYQFWNYIYKNSDFMISVLRHPAERALSYLRMSGINFKEEGRASLPYLYEMHHVNENNNSTVLECLEKRGYTRLIDSSDY